MNLEQLYREHGDLTRRCAAQAFRIEAQQDVIAELVEQIKSAAEIEQDQAKARAWWQSSRDSR